MRLSENQYVEMGKAAMQALVSCNDSIILNPDEIAEKAWALAEAMAKKFNEASPDRQRTPSQWIGDTPPGRPDPNKKW